MSVTGDRGAVTSRLVDDGLQARSRPLSRRRRGKVVRLLVLSDLITVVLAMLLSLLATEHHTVIPMRWAAATCVLTLLIFAAQGLYERDKHRISVSAFDEVRDVLTGLGFVGFTCFAVAVVFKVRWMLPPEPLSVLFYFFAGTILVSTGRAALRHRVIPKAIEPERMIVVGAGTVGQAVVRKIRRNRLYNVEVVGFLDDDPTALEPDVADVPILGSEADMLDAIVKHGATRVVLAFSRSTHDEVLEHIRAAGLRDIQISIVPRYFEIIAANVKIADVEGITLLEIPVASLSRLARVTKRAFDLAVTVPALLLLSPLLAAISLAIVLDSRGGVFFRQLRMGQDDKPFWIWKFRTMVVGAEQMRDTLLDDNESTGPLFKIRQDPRITRVGSILRKLSLDELPQLLNVVRGEMSLVGPRPFVLYEDNKIEGWARRRLELKPGITGLWQVLGRNDIEYHEMVKLDYLYVTNWSLWWDLRLILRTVPIVLGRRGY